jgi:hypothetical protein
MLDGMDFAGQNVAVNVVEQIEGDEQRDRGQNGAVAGAAWRMG